MKTTATAMRPFEDPDLDALIQMVEAHLREDVELTIGPWSRSEAMLRIEMPAARDDIKVIEGRGGQPIAFFWVTTQDKALVLDEIHVVASARGTGLGRAMMEEVTREALRRGLGRIHLSVFTHSPQVAFYEKLGFEELGRDSKRHQIKMGKELEGVG